MAVQHHGGTARGASRLPHVLSCSGLPEGVENASGLAVGAPTTRPVETGRVAQGKILGHVNRGVVGSPTVAQSSTYLLLRGIGYRRGAGARHRWRARSAS
ncbi:hypothetical protein [Streptomyces sp.]|uniref:hypothetical protein n=1 Tax=Streptomyces sp. TaxID=1931 RepID=UPI002F42023A